MAGCRERATLEHLSQTQTKSFAAWQSQHTTALDTPSPCLHLRCSDCAQIRSGCRIGMEACVGAHHLSRNLQALGHDARLMLAKYVRPYSKGDKNEYRDAEAIAEAVRRPTMKFVAA